MIIETVNLLGYKAKDKITGLEGVIASVCFDLFGCVQVILTPPKTDDGRLPDSHWFDVSRVDVTDSVPVMSRPDFVGRAAHPKDYDRGPTDKPSIITIARR